MPYREGRRKMGSNTQPKDMRTWILELDSAGELIRVDKRVDPLTQMGSLRRNIHADPELAALLSFAFLLFSAVEAPHDILRHVADLVGVCQDRAESSND
jgi:hypothetical protein